MIRSDFFKTIGAAIGGAFLARAPEIEVLGKAPEPEGLREAVEPALGYDPDEWADDSDWYLPDQAEECADRQAELLAERYSGQRETSLTVTIWNPKRDIVESVYVAAEAGIVLNVTLEGCDRSGIRHFGGYVVSVEQVVPAPGEEGLRFELRHVVGMEVAGGNGRDAVSLRVGPDEYEATLTYSNPPQYRGVIFDNR